MFTTRLTTPLGVCVLVSLLSAPAMAATVGFELRIGGGKNAPILHLLNTSTTASITHAEVTIGDTGFNFNDYFVKHLNTVDFTATIEEDGGVRTDILSADFTNFDPGKAFRVKVDVDIDNEDSKVDFRNILFDLGGPDSSDNALVSVNFSDGTFLSGNLPDYESEPDGAYIFGLSREVGGPGGPPQPAIPLPPGLWAGLTLLGGLGAFNVVRKTFRKIP